MPAGWACLTAKDVSAIGGKYSIRLELPPIVAPKWFWIRLDVLRLAWKVFSIKTIIYGKISLPRFAWEGDMVEAAGVELNVYLFDKYSYS